MTHPERYTEKHTTMITKNLYTVADLLGAATVIAAAAAKFGKTDTEPVAVLAFITAGVVATQTLCGNVVIQNPHRLHLWVKPEDGETPYITSDETITGADGVKIAGKVYKFRNGTHVTICTDGTVKTESLTGKLLNWLGGGLLTAPPDDSWKPLFEA